MVVWTLAKKDLRLLLRDRRALIILLAMPVLFIMVLGLSLGEGFFEKPDDRLRVTIVDLDEGGYDTAHGFPAEKWSRVVQRDLEQAAGIKVELVETKEKARQLVRDGKVSAVLVFGPEFSARVSRCSFLDEVDFKGQRVKGINPLFADGINLEVIDAELLRDPTQATASSIIEQVAQVTMLRVILPWMIGRAFEKIGEVEFIDKMGKTVEVPIVDPVFGKVVGKAKLEQLLKTQEQKAAVGKGVQVALQEQFSKYNLTGKTWAALTKSEQRGGPTAASTRRELRYQILVPSQTVMFAFFLVLTVGWLFVAERREGTLKRLRAAPLTRGQILLGKMIPCFLLSLAQGLFLLAAGKIVFGMRWGPAQWPIYEQVLWLLPVVLATSIAAMGMSLLVASLAQTETQVAIYGTLIVLVLAGISGCLMPRDMMPENMKQISKITPHAWALDAYNQLLIDPDPSLRIVATACLVLIGFGLGFVAIAWSVLKLE
ncbi:MAG: ABC transporter permease [Gemmataceae bacterium]